MALTKKNLKVTDELLGKSEVKEAVELERDFILDAYEKNVALTKIAEAIDSAYKKDFTTREVTFPKAGSNERVTKKVKPTVRIEHIRTLLENEGVLKDKDKKKTRN